MKSILLLYLLTIMMCRAATDGSTPAKLDASVTADKLVAGLRSAGIAMEPRGTIQQPFFAVAARVFGANGNDLQIFEYRDPASAQADAEKVSPDGTSIGTSSMHWVAQPHFFRGERLIVLYLGDEATVLSALRSQLGPQFAGR